jgi:hypothetical protein
MELNLEEFKFGPLLEKHALATWNFIIAFA